MLARTLAEISQSLFSLLCVAVLRAATCSSHSLANRAPVRPLAAQRVRPLWKHTTDGVGSGRGLLKVFGVARDGSVWNTYMHNDRALVVIEDEIDNIAALKDEAAPR